MVFKIDISKFFTELIDQSMIIELNKQVFILSLKILEKIKEVKKNLLNLDLLKN